MLETSTTILIILIISMLLCIIFSKDEHNNHKDRNKDRNKHIKSKYIQIPHETYINKANTMLQDLSDIKNELVGIATEYVLNRTNYENELDEYISYADSILKIAQVKQSDSASIINNIVTTTPASISSSTSIITTTPFPSESSSGSVSEDLQKSILENLIALLASITAQATIAQQNAQTALLTINIIKNLLAGNTLPPGMTPPPNFGDAITSIQEQQQIASIAYEDVQTQLQIITEIFSISSTALDTITDNLNKAREDLDKLKTYISKLTGNIQKTNEYINLQNYVTNANSLLSELKKININLDSSSPYYYGINNLIINLTTSIDTSQQYLDNAINIFIHATSDSSYQLNSKFEILYSTYNNIFDIIGTPPVPLTTPVSTTSTPIILALSNDYPIITNKPINKKNMQTKSENNSLYSYQQQIIEINEMIKTQYNLIIEASNQVIGVINSIQEITQKIINSLNIEVNDFKQDSVVNELKNILLYYFPASTSPPLKIPDLNLLIEFAYTPIPTQSAVL
jgi:hypothetical protein